MLGTSGRSILVCVLVSRKKNLREDRKSQEIVLGDAASDDGKTCMQPSVRIHCSRLPISARSTLRQSTRSGSRCCGSSITWTYKLSVAWKAFACVRRSLCVLEPGKDMVSMPCSPGLGMEKWIPSTGRDASTGEGRDLCLAFAGVPARPFDEG